MKPGLSLFILYALGKGITIAVHDFKFGLETVPVLLWQDALVATVVVLAFRCSKAAGWILYATAVLHFAISLPLLRIMATPLTAPLLRAGSGTLADSMRHHVDAVNLSLLLGALLIGAILPFVLRRMRGSVHPAFQVSAMSGILAGYVCTASADLQGLHRNSLIAFARSFGHTTDATVLRAIPEQRHSSALHGVLKGANVILIGFESTGARHLSTYGATNDPMPVLSRLAREGVIFENGYAPYPESIKGLYALLFSRQPRFGFDPEDLAGHSDSSIASIAWRHGYETALFHSGRFMYLGMDSVVAAAGFEQADDAGAIGGNHNSSFGVDDFSAVDHLLKWLDQRATANPFLIHYLPISGHHPYEAPIRGPFAGADDQSRYRNALYYSDRSFERLLDGLEKRGLLANTLLIAYGDHGEAFGEHPGNYGHTLYLYEENVRVPLIFWMPEKLRPARLPRVTSLIDVAPSICDLLGMEPSPEFQGVSAFTANDRPALFCTDYSMHLRGIRHNEWKLIVEKESRYTRLYDLGRDPGEQTNLAGTRPEVVSTLRRQFLEWSGTGVRSKVPPNHETLARR
jgi:phosphoglycerol transferase MdoB-like AlkP superfamily enzyme